jgi:hypothetical protein
LQAPVIVLLSLSLALSAACDEQRRRDCDALVVAMKPLDAPNGNEKALPTLETVDGVKKQVESMKVSDQTLGVHVRNYVKTLGVLASTVALKSSSSPPDGTDDVIRTNLKQARSVANDVKRYCAE